MTLSTQLASYAGSDSANVQSKGRFQGILYMANEHMRLSMGGRKDIRELAHTNVKEGRMPASLLEDLTKQCAKNYSVDSSRLWC